METIQARVSKRLLSKADRLFTGTLDGRIIEILQNARRAGATQVKITNKDGFITVRDNGSGIEDFSTLLDLGDSDWDEALEKAEDPAGVGIFCLAPRQVTIASGDRKVCITEKAWTGELVPILKSGDSIKGTMLVFKDEPWAFSTVDLACSMIGLDFEATFIEPVANKSTTTYLDYQWLVTPHSLVETGQVIHAVPEISSCDNTAWEEWFLLEGKIHHNILYTIKNERTTDEFPGEIDDKDHPLLVLGRKWYHYTDENLLPLDFQN